MLRLECSFAQMMRRWAQQARGPRTPYHQSDESALISFPAYFVDISVTAASVLKGTGASTATGIAGATITAGQPLYADSSASNTLKPADCDLSSAAATVVGISLHAALTGQPITYLTAGNMTFNAVLTTGKAYISSATAGGIAPIADLATGWYTTMLGIATSTTNLSVNIVASGAINA